MQDEFEQIERALFGQADGNLLGADGLSKIIELAQKNKEDATVLDELEGDEEASEPEEEEEEEAPNQEGGDNGED